MKSNKRSFYFIGKYTLNRRIDLTQLLIGKTDFAEKNE